MTLKNIFYASYWFNQPDIAVGLAFYVSAAGFLFLIIGGLILRIISQYQQERALKIVLRRFSGCGMFMGLWGISWLFFRQEQIPFLAWRFWLMIWLLVAVWWLTSILQYILKRLPVIKKEKESKAKIEKYLPNN